MKNKMNELIKKQLFNKRNNKIKLILFINNV